MSIVQETKTHLTAVLQGTAVIDDELLEKIISQLTLDKSLFVSTQNNVIVELLPPSIGILQSVSAQGNIKYVIDLIAALLAYSTFEDVVKYIPVAQLDQALSSGAAPLQRVCIVQIGKADPADLIATTPLVDTMLTVFGDLRTESSVVQAIQNALVELSSRGELVLKRIFSRKSQVFNMRESGDAVLISRVLGLVESVYASGYEAVPEDLVQFSNETFDPASPKWDVLDTVLIVQFYRTVLQNPVHPQGFAKSIYGELKGIANMYSVRDQHEDVKMFLLTEIVLLFRELSYQEYDMFRSFDSEYSIITTSLSDKAERGSILTFVNPRYLFEFYTDAIDSTQINSADLSILRNLVTYEPTFKQLDLTQSKLLQLSYSDLLILLIVIIQTPFGLSTLLQDWPQVMTELVNKPNVREPEIFNLRREALELLYNKPASSLGVWSDGVKEAYKEVILGAAYGQDIQALVADQSM